jgi:hypothetical protein
MKKIASRLSSSSYIQLVILGITLLLAALAVVAASATPKAFASQASGQSAGEGAQEKFQRVRMVGEGISGSLSAGEVNQSSTVPASPTGNPLINNNSGATGTSNFTQSETTIVAFGSTIVAGFNDSGSFTGGFDAFTGWSRSTDGGATWTDGGRLPASAIGDAGDPVLARDNTTGRIYFSTLGFNSPGTIQVFRSDTNGASWQAPVNGTPGGDDEDKEWITVDNFPGAGNGNVYLVSRRFGVGPGIYLFRSTDDGATFGPSGGNLIVANNQGAFVTVSPNHSVHVFWYAGSTLQVRKSTDQGLTFSAPVTVASGLIGGGNGDLGLTGVRQGTGAAAPFRSNEFPHAAVNPLSSNDIYVTYNNKGLGADKANIFLTQSTNGGATWSAPVKVNDDSTTTDQWQPTVVVSPGGDKLGIFYSSRQDDPTNNNLFRYYGRVGDILGGTVTFTPSFAVSNTASLPEFGRDSVVNSTYMGDYNQVYATPDFFHIVWSDNRDNLPGGAPRKDPNVYYNRVTLNPPTPTTFNNLILNAGFETGSFSPWVIDGTNSTPVISAAEHHSGTRSALLGTVSGPEPFGDSSFYQQITVPAAGGTLSYWWLGATSDTITFDWQDAYVINTSNTILATISHTCANTGGWVHQTFDMTPYAGQTVRIKFLVHQDGFFDDTSMYVDDVQLTSPNANYVLYNAGTRATAVWRLNNNVLTGGVLGPTLPAGWSLVGAADFNGNLNPDYLLFNLSTHQSAIWYLSGVTFAGGAFGPTLPSGWVLVTTADFNGDGKPDYVLYNGSTRQTAVWYMNNNVFLSGAFGPTLPAGWRLADAADFNEGGHPDYLLFNPSTRQSAIWYLSGVTFIGGLFGPTIASGYQLTGAADFNRNGSPDYVLYNASTHQTAIWYMNNNVFLSGAFGPTLPAAWSLVDALPSVP